MTSSPAVTATLRFSYQHFETEGKLVNTIEALEQIKAKRVCLGLSNGPLDPAAANLELFQSRLERVRKVIAKLRRRSIQTELVLPSLTEMNPKSSDAQQLLKSLYSLAPQTKAAVIWIDDAAKSHHHNFNTPQMTSWFQTIRQSVRKKNPKIKLGLIAAEPEQYLGLDLSAEQLAQILSSGKKSSDKKSNNQTLLAQNQSFRNDYNRIDILQTARELTWCQALRDPAARYESIGQLGQDSHCTFGKSTEATEMQINLNLLFGNKSLLLNCFDWTGISPGSENPYLHKLINSRKLYQKLSNFLADRPEHYGLCIIVPEKARGSSALANINPWFTLLWRMGFPVKCATPKSVKKISDTVFILAGNLPNQLTATQLKHVFQQGVLLDVDAAQTLQKMGRNDFVGLEVGAALHDVQTEILSDQTFANRQYGRHTILTGNLPVGSCRKLKPIHDQARFITTMQRKNRIPNTKGMIIFDNNDLNHRSAVLPYSLGNADPVFLLNQQRQQHFQDLFQWLNRGRLNCFVENAPDLVPFYITDTGKRRIIIALLNVGFDWAIDARLRLARLPFAVKRVRELDQNGKLESYPELKLQIAKDYQFVQLHSDTAVPPMQITILLLEG
ncbi:MAG: hypothetical protein JXD22_11150 [Sedimentisphaerales bacterium]|nr:hypothetical protein [Sedimentisphaerales bacterium]